VLNQRGGQLASEVTTRKPRGRTETCDFCGQRDVELIRVTQYTICTVCSADLGHFILQSSRELLSAVFGVPIEEATSIRKVSGGLADHITDSGRVHADLARSYVEAGDYGDALTEASIALVSRPAVASVVAQALEVLFSPKLSPSVVTLKLHLKKHA